MTPESFPPPTWQTVLDWYEVDWAAVGAHGGLDFEPVIAPADFVRAVMTCRGHERLTPGTSHMRLFVARPRGVMVWRTRRTGFELDSITADGRGEVVTRQTVRGAVRAFRRMLRKTGVRLGPPRWEQPPAEFYRRAWLVFPGGRMR